MMDNFDDIQDAETQMAVREIRVLSEKFADVRKLAKCSEEAIARLLVAVRAAALEMEDHDG